MSNLKKQVAAIKQQLAVSTAETVARFCKVETDMTSRIRALETRVAEGFQEMRSAAEDQAKVQQAALDQLLDLVAEDPRPKRSSRDRGKPEGPAGAREQGRGEAARGLG